MKADRRAAAKPLGQVQAASSLAATPLPVGLPEPVGQVGGMISADPSAVGASMAGADEPVAFCHSLGLFDGDLALAPADRALAQLAGYSWQSSAVGLLQAGCGQDRATGRGSAQDDAIRRWLTTSPDLRSTGAGRMSASISGSSRRRAARIRCPRSATGMSSDG